eukprot:2150376-Prymnesium_polylepis.1
MCGVRWGAESIAIGARWRHPLALRSFAAVVLSFSLLCGFAFLQSFSEFECGAFHALGSCILERVLGGSGPRGVGDECITSD